jgi:hypothetical protein
MQSVRENMQIRTGKRLGFKFQADKAVEGWTTLPKNDTYF